MQIANLPLVLRHVGNIIRNGAAKRYRHTVSRARRVGKRTAERVKNTVTRLRVGVDRSRDEAAHLRVSAVRTARYWRRVRRQVVDPVRDDVSIRRRLQSVAAGSGPIVAGPWLSEVGYEVLYWVPFLRWFTHHYRVDPGRVVVVSRGGVAPWYAGLGDRYVELLDLFDPDDLARRNAERHVGGDQKQLDDSDLDAEVLRRVGARCGIEDAAVLHPSLMFRLLRRFWLGNASLEYVLGYLRYAAVPEAVGLALPPLPARYQVAKFYTGTALRDTPGHREQLRVIVERMASRAPVVALGTGLRFDEHEDFLFDGIAGVTSLSGALDARSNLAVQTEVIRGASLFAGTAGSVAWLAPMLGIDSVALYSDDRFLGPHLYAARYAYASMASGRFMPLDIRAADSLDLLAVSAAAAGRHLGGGRA